MSRLRVIASARRQQKHSNSCCLSPIATLLFLFITTASGAPTTSARQLAVSEIFTSLFKSSIEDGVARKLAYGFLPTRCEHKTRPLVFENLLVDLEGLQRDTFNAFIASNSDPRAVGEEPDLPFPINWVDPYGIVLLKTAPIEGLEVLRGLPPATRFVVSSNVGLNGNLNQALVCIEVYEQSFGQSMYFLLDKPARHWKVIDRAGGWLN